MPWDLISGRYVPEKTNIWRDCVDGYVDWVKEHVAEGAPLNEADFCGDPPLVLAAGNGHLAVVKFLIDEGADLQQCGLMRDTPLHRAAHNGHLQTVKYLLEEGAELDALDVGDNTALHWASMRGHVEIVKELLEQGADKTITNNEDKLPVDLCQAFWSPAWQFTRAVLED
jgi:ankyrin repeat protein